MHSFKTSLPEIVTEPALCCICRNAILFFGENSRQKSSAWKQKSIDCDIHCDIHECSFLCTSNVRLNREM